MAPGPGSPGDGVAPGLLARVEAGGLLDPPRSLVVLLSGGRDSVCLLDLAVRARGPAAVLALHVDYGFRPESHDDADFCLHLCERLGVEATLERPVRPEGPGNLQAWARDARYAVAARLAEARDATIVTGHTADDQVETILYRLASSPSRRALLGMKGRDGRLARPLLATTRAEVTAYDEERGLVWREDATNAEEGYARNRVRHGLVPELEAIHPSAVANVLRTAALLRDEGEVLDALVADELDGSLGAPRGRVVHARFAALSPALRRLVLQRLADAAAGRPVPGAARFADQVAGLTRGGSRLDLGDGVRAVLQEGVLRAEREG
ncbi:MAG TPA: tRNA lysidine(34) synthetase TilS [Solirubrobacterales bacterium]|nr:tRNA lysidine(34) synthetase TilS [Solirubrobacterales bacterium]